MLDVKKFDKLIQKTTAGGLDTFDEIAEMLGSLIKLEVDASQDKLIQRVSEHAEFTSVDDFQTFLTGYFEFHNALIFEIDKTDAIKNDLLYENALSKLSEKILYSVGSENPREYVLKISLKIFETVMDEYHVETIDNFDESLKQLTNIFGRENIAMLFMGLTAIIEHFIKEDVDKEEIIDSMATILTFVMALNNLRKKDFFKSQEKSSHLTSANSVNYNVGRNDPCPCGSGRKYKKCCLNKTQTKPLESIIFDEPKDIMKPFSEKETHEFYMIWARFTNYVGKIFADAIDRKYIKIYEKNSKKQYALTDEILKDNLYLNFRDFLVNYFFDLTNDFINENRVSQNNIDILYEIRDTFKKDKFYIFEMFDNGNAIFYNAQTHECFYSHKIIFDYSKVYQKNVPLDTMLFSYKGRIITDGIAAKYNVEIGDNMQEIIKKEYGNDRKNLLFALPINENKQTIYQLKISIKGAKPPIWRRVEVNSNISFYELHNIVQDIFNWENYHLYLFNGNHGSYTEEESIQEDHFYGSKDEDAAKHRINEELQNPKDKINYTYDFGDDWEHVIVLEKILDSDENVIYPRCTGGKRRGPPEDCGGIWNYNDIANAIENPTDNNQDILGEDGESYYENINPDEFDKKIINMLLNNN